MMMPNADLFFKIRIFQKICFVVKAGILMANIAYMTRWVSDSDLATATQKPKKFMLHVRWQSDFRC